jgi:catechol 2,3-dioxygenase-like lactoylglutathione lyase family enzyme
MRTTGVHHICIRVQDQEVSRRWYEDVLGFEAAELPPSPAMLATWRGSPDSGTVVALRAGDTFITLQPPLEGTPAEDRFSEHRIGVDHLALAVEDRGELDTLVERLRAAGVATQGVVTHPVLGKDFVTFRDPDNVQWEAFMV